MQRFPLFDCQVWEKMKNLFAIISILVLLSCNKNNTHDAKTVFVQGKLQYRIPAADGPGWFIRPDNNPSPIYIILESSIPQDFKKTDIRVIATLEETNIPFQGMSATPGNSFYYKIVTISKF